MRIEHLTFTSERWWGAVDAPPALTAAQLVLVFGERDLLENGSCLEPLRARFPAASIVSCSGGGTVTDERVITEGAVATAIEFESSRIRTADAVLTSAEDSEHVGGTLAAALDDEGLRHVLVFAEGLHVNGSALARGFADRLPPAVSVSGGLAADGDRFLRTAVGLDGPASTNRAVAVGLYGDRLEVGIGSFGGWDAFGPDRVITRSEGNVLYELDGRNVLELYKELLGPLGYALPASGLLFPLEVRESPESSGLVRTILGVDEAAGSVTFAGDVPQGWSARLVRTNLDQLIAAAGTAAERARGSSNRGNARLGLAVSCIGRRLLLQQRVGEEVATVRQALGAGTQLTGFYSYGELAPSASDAPCELHNQTMTITTLAEW